MSLSDLALAIISISLLLAVIYLGLLIGETVGFAAAVSSLTVALSVLIVFGVLWFIWFRMRSRIAYRIAVDTGVKLVFCGAKPVRQFEKDSEPYLELKTKCFDTPVIVPRNSFRIFHSRLRGNYMTWLVDGKGTPKAWGEDKIKDLDYEKFRMIQQEKMYANVLGLTRWLPIIKLLVIAIIIVVIVLGAIIGYQISQQPQIIVKVPLINATAANTTTAAPGNITLPAPG